MLADDVSCLQDGVVAGQLARSVMNAKASFEGYRKAVLPLDPDHIAILVVLSSRAPLAMRSRPPGEINSPTASRATALLRSRLAASGSARNDPVSASVKERSRTLGQPA
jgi:hypothetical protein